MLKDDAPPSVASLALERENKAYLGAVQRLSQNPKQAISRATRVSKPVPGLYDSIPVQNVTEINGIRIEMTDFGAQFYSREGFPIGRLRRTIKDNAIYFDGSQFDRGGETAVPGFVEIPGVIPLVKERGVPTQAFATLQKMKMEKIPYGGLEVAHSNNVENVKTSLQLIRSQSVQKWMALHPNQAVPPEVLTQALPETHSWQYMETVLTQSGHQISSVKMEADQMKWIPLRKLLYQHESEIDDEVLALLVKETGPKGQKIPFSPDQLVPYGFKMKFDLKPY